MALDSGYFEVEKPFVSNGDRFRAMSDEDIAVWCRAQIGCGFDYFPCGIVCDGKCETYTTEECQAKIIEWLQRPVEEERWQLKNG